MNILCNIDDDRSDEELEEEFGVNAEANGDVNDGMEANVPNVGRIRAALQNIPVPRNGGMNQCQSWTGGPMDPGLRTGYSKTGLCYRGMTIQHRVFLRSERGVGDAWLIKTKSTVTLSSSLVKIKDGIAALGLDSVFDIQIRGV